MKNLSIKKVSLYGFFSLFIVIILGTAIMILFAAKYENLHQEQEKLKKSYVQMLKYKYYTERLLTTTDLTKEKKLWITAKSQFKESMDNLKIKDEIFNKNILEFYNIINTESDKIIKQLDTAVFTHRNVLEKSILRRLGEGLNSNETSDYYLAISDLKNSIDYLKQYEEFLLDEILELTNKQQRILNIKINQLKSTAILSIILIILSGAILAVIIIKLITKIEKDLLKTKNELQDTLDETNIILNTSMESIMIAKDKICIDVNEETLRTFGYENKDDLIGKPTTIFISPDSLDLVKEKQSNNICEPYEANCIASDGKIFPALIKGYNFINKNGQTIRVSAIIDLTEVKATEDLLFKQAKMAMMGEMLENIAHQWRQPLSVISSAASGIILKKEYKINKEEDELAALNTINNSVQHLSQTIDDFRSFFSVNKEKNIFDVCEAFDKAEDLLSSKFKNRSIKVYKQTKQVNLLGYKNEFVQAFMNLLNNAKDALEENLDLDRKLIFFTTKIENNIATVSVKDNGGGIPKAVLPNIFNEHFTTKGDKDGTGIGLYMTKMIIEKVNGTIEAYNSEFTFEDKHYKGAEFVITLDITQTKEFE